MSIIIIFTVIGLIFFVDPTSQNELPYQSCNSTFECGNITGIGYPFWGSNRPVYCGHPEFLLNCTALKTLIMIQQVTYQVFEIDTQMRNLKVARTDYIGGLCPTNPAKTTLNSTFFTYAPDSQNIFLYYGCPANVPSSLTTAATAKSTVTTTVYSPSNSGQKAIAPATATASIDFPGLYTGIFSCNITNDTDGLYVLRIPDKLTSVVRDYVGACDRMVIVLANQSAVQTLQEGNLTEENLVMTLGEGFGMQWTANDSSCRECEWSGGKCGYNTTTSSFACHCPNSTHLLSCPQFPSRKDIKVPDYVLVIVIIAAAIVGSCLVCCLSISRVQNWVKSKLYGFKKTELDEKVETFIANYQSLVAKRFSYWDIAKMTNSFANKLGHGGFGDVYKGKLPDGRLVAVKVLNNPTSDGEDFINEVATTSRTSHVNVVTLLGFCFERNKRALLYEYMPNGSLANFINGHGAQNLERKALHDIAAGMARGLEYLHRGCNARIVHFDIKPHNILLDENFCPKISDFGLAKLCKGKESMVSMSGQRGTPGYVAPEVFMRDSRGVSYKSDVYSYGMMILEMFVGKNITNNVGLSNNNASSEIYFSDWIYKHLEPGVISRVHENVLKEEEEMVRRMIIVGLWCIQTNPADRPSMTKVVEMLEGNTESLQIPPKPRLFPASNGAPLVSSSLS